MDNMEIHSAVRRYVLTFPGHTDAPSSQEAGEKRGRISNFTQSPRLVDPPRNRPTSRCLERLKKIPDLPQDAGDRRIKALDEKARAEEALARLSTDEVRINEPRRGRRSTAQ